MTISKKTGIKIVILSMIFIVSFVLYYVCCKKSGIYYASDSTFHIIAGKEIMSGNILLNKWYGSRNNLYFVSLLYGIFGSAYGYSMELLWIVPAFLWASLLALVSWIILYFNSEKPCVCASRLCFVFILCYSSSYFLNQSKILTGVHFDVAVVGILYMWVISREIESCQNLTFLLITVSCLVFLILLSDSLAQVYIIFPVFAGLLFNLLFLPEQKIKKTYLKKHLVLCVALFIGAKIVFKLLQSSGQAIVAYSVSGVDVLDWTDLFSGIAFWIKSCIYLFGCDIFGKHIGVGSIILIFRIFALFLTLIGIGLSLKNLVGNIFNHFLLFCMVAVSLIVIFTHDGREGENPTWTSRLMYCFYFSTVLLAAQIDWNRVVSLIQFKISNKIYLGIGMAAMLFMMIFNMSILWTEDERVSESYNGYVRIADVLVEKGLTRGYGTLWLTSSVTVASGYRTEVRPVAWQNLALDFWLTDTDTDGWDYANFVLVDDSMWTGVSEQSVIDCIGVPEERIQVDRTTILIWDKNIIPYISDPGETGEMLAD